MTLRDKLIKIRDALVAVEGLRVYHYWRPKLQPPYCIWEEEGEASALHANDHKHEQAIDGHIDYFTKMEFDPAADAIQDSLNRVEHCGWSYDSVQYEDETGLIHHSWRFTVT